MCEKNREILVATTNPGKIAEMRAMLGGGVRWLGLVLLFDPLLGC